MPKQQPATSKQDYSTPQVFIDAVKSYLGVDKFDWDFAADESNTKADYYYNERYNALSSELDWQGCIDAGWGWLNPPYKDITPWAAKCLQTAKDGGRVAFLVPASVGSNWYRDYIHNQFGVKTLFLNGRLCFINNWRTLLKEDGTKMYTSEPLYPKDTMLVLFGTEEPYSSDVWTWRDECPRVSSVVTRKPRKSRSNGSSLHPSERSVASSRVSG